MTAFPRRFICIFIYAYDLETRVIECALGHDQCAMKVIDPMEARVVMKNQDMIAVRLLDGTYTVFRLKTDRQVEIGDVFEGQMTSPGIQVLHHVASDSLVEVQIKLAGTLVAAKTKQALGASLNPL